MSLIIFVALPLLWALTGKLLGLAVTASCFYSASGKRAGQKISRWCVPICPSLFLALMVVGDDGNAGHGMHVFGSAEFFDLLCVIPLYVVPVLGVYVVSLYVIRDLTLGHEQS